MKPSRVRTFTFSPTGTTLRVTQAVAGPLAEAFGVPLAEGSFVLPGERQEEVSFAEDELVVVALPTYAGRIPNLILPFLRDKVHGQGALAVPVVTFGNRNYDDSLMELRNVLEANGFHTVAGAAFSCEHSFSRILGANRPDEKDLSIAAGFAARVHEKVAALTEAPTAPAPVGGQDPIRPYYTPRDRHGNGIDIRKVKPLTSEACTGCGWCAAHCPMGAISAEDPHLVPGVCIKCCACEKGCPVGAKYFEDKGYLYHKTELEEVYGPVRKEPELFV